MCNCFRFAVVLMQWTLGTYLSRRASVFEQLMVMLLFIQWTLDFATDDRWKRNNERLWQFQNTSLKNDKLGFRWFVRFLLSGAFWKYGILWQIPKFIYLFIYLNVLEGVQYWQYSKFSLNRNLNSWNLNFELHASCFRHTVHNRKRNKMPTS
jgi:hypothetical protein